MLLSDRSDVCLPDVCLWRTSGLTREQRGQTKIGTEVAHTTRDSDTTFKVKRSKIKVTRPLWLVVLAGQHGHTVMRIHMRTWRISCHHLQAWAGAYRGGRPPTACYITLHYINKYLKCPKSTGTTRTLYEIRGNVGVQSWGKTIGKQMGF